jgi:hypothetical protein
MEQDIVRLDIPMYDLLRMNSPKNFYHLVSD